MKIISLESKKNNTASRWTFAVYCVLIFVVSTFSISAQEPTQLTFENPIVGTIEKSERKVFKISINKGEFAHVEVQQNLIFVHPVVFNSAGEKLFEVRRPVDYLDIKRFTLLAETEPKEFTIELTGDRRDAHGNGFGIKIARHGKIDSEIRLRYEAEQKLFGIPVFPTDFSDKEIVIKKYESILESVRKINDWQFEALVLHTLGSYHYTMFQNSIAVSYFEKSLDICQKHDYKKCEAANLNQMSPALLYLGENDEALSSIEKGLAMYEELKNPWGITSLLNVRSQLQYRLGQFEQAKQSALKGIQVYGDAHPRCYLYLGNANFALGEYEEALKNYQTALDKMSADNDKIPYNRTLWRIGEVYIPLGNYEKATQYFTEVIHREEKENKFWSRNGALTGFGIVQYKLGNFEKSLKYFADSIAANVEVEDKLGEALSRYWIAKIDFERGNLSKALEEIKTSIEISENLRSKISVEELKTSYTATISDYYELNIEILNKLKKQNPKVDYDVQAFGVSERSRARTFLELIKSSSFDFRRSVSPGLLEDERDLQNRINETALIKGRLRRGTNNKTEQQTLENELQKLTSELDFVRSKIRKQNSAYASLTQNLPTVTLSELQKNLLDADTVLIEYKLGKEQSFVWTITDKSFAMYELPKAEIIEAKAKKVYAIQSKRNKDDTNLANNLTELGRLILSPIEKDLQKKRILVVADGSLQYIPFASLKTNGKYLVENSEIFNLPSATFLSESRKKDTAKVENKKLIAILADPVFDKNDARLNFARRVSYNPDSLPRLLFSRQEANAIASIVPKNDLFLAMDFEANKNTATNNFLSSFRIVHFATHGVLDSEHPELSGLVLSMLDEKGNPQNGFLRLHEVYNLKLPADLVVLSGCQTGLGKEVRGEGLIGLTRGFMYAGASRVAASLWQIDDSATAELMKNFYTAMLKEKQTPSEALRTAQLQMLSQKRFQNPYFWASFTIQGDWR